MQQRYHSWGRFPKRDQCATILNSRFDPLPLIDKAQATALPFGNGRSYGDSCLNSDGLLYDVGTLNRFISFDADSGILRCEAGVQLDTILRLVVPQGWFLVVTPGTCYATVGGAIANDVHGKNHHCKGTFGHHVPCFELLRSDGERLLCSATENVDLYRATIGGLGLTGVMTWAEIRLRRIHNPYMQTETIRMDHLGDFLRLCAESDRDYEYTVAWIDCLAKGKKLGRGLFIRGNHAPPLLAERAPAHRESRWSVPLDAPAALLNPLTLRLFNTLYYHKQRQPMRRALVHYRPFFYPLDAINNWNRLYGKNGFLQYQCVVPGDGLGQTIRDILKQISQTRMGSFLAILKAFGEQPSLGLMSFPRPGITLALDFQNSGPRTFKLLNKLDEIVCANGGAVYPAKDARMSAQSFRRYFPQIEQFKHYIDPNFCSDFWRRVGGTKP